MAASVSTSYVSGHETLDCRADGVMPPVLGRYVAWRVRQLAETGRPTGSYSWTRPVNISGVSVAIGYDDRPRCPRAVGGAAVAGDGRAWTEITNRDGGGLPLQKNAFNMLTFRRSRPKSSAWN